MRWVWFAVVAGCGATVSGDRDQDGYLGVAVGGTDCNDADALVNPGQAEQCGDGVDNDCDGRVDDRGVGEVEWFVDADGDGFGAEGSGLVACPSSPPKAGLVAVGGDCDDTLAGVNPGVAVDGCDRIDEDCDTEVDEDAPLAAVDGKAFDDLDRAIRAAIAADELAVVEVCTQSDPTLVEPVRLGFEQSLSVRGAGETVRPVLRVLDGDTLFGVGASASLTLQRLAIEGARDGAAVHVSEQAEAVLQAVELSDNPGGAIAIDGETRKGSVARVEVRDSVLRDNGGEAVLGGAVSATGWFDLALEGVEITGNRGQQGGGIYAVSDDPGLPELDWRDVEIGYNQAVEGGGIYVESLDLQWLDVVLQANTALDGGGGIVRRSVVMGIGGAEVSDNTANDKGGGFVVEGSTLSGLSLSGNQGVEGGAMFVRHVPPASASSELTALWVEDNQAQIGGGLSVASGVAASIRNSAVISNVATTFGGGAFLEGGQTSLLSDGTHWGVGTTDNAASDVEMLTTKERFEFSSKEDDFLCTSTPAECTAFK